MIKVANNLTGMALTQAKRAALFDSTPDTMSSINPLTLGAYGSIYGGLLGAGVGPLVELLRKKEEKDYLKAMLMGLGIGGGAGALVGAGAAPILRHGITHHGTPYGVDIDLPPERTPEPSHPTEKMIDFKNQPPFKLLPM